MQAGEDDAVQAKLNELRKPGTKTGFKGVIVAKPGKSKPYQARMDNKTTGQKQQPLPGLYEEADEAAIVLAKAMLADDHGGYVWAEKGERRKRGEVRAALLLPCDLNLLLTTTMQLRRDPQLIQHVHLQGMRIRRCPRGGQSRAHPIQRWCRCRASAEATTRTATASCGVLRSRSRS